MIQLRIDNNGNIVNLDELRQAILGHMRSAERALYALIPVRMSKGFAWVIALPTEDMYRPAFYYIDAEANGNRSMYEYGYRPMYDLRDGSVVSSLEVNESLDTMYAYIVGNHDYHMAHHVYPSAEVRLKVLP